MLSVFWEALKLFDSKSLFPSRALHKGKDERAKLNLHSQSDVGSDDDPF